MAIDNRAVRDLIDINLLLDSDLDAFLIDNFPKAERQISNGMDRTAKINILLRQYKAELVAKKLRQWCSDFKDIPQDTDADHQPSAHPLQLRKQDDARVSTEVRYAVVITTTVDTMDRAVLLSIVEHLRTLSNDTKLTLCEVRSGSVILIVNGTREGFEKLKTLFYTNKINEIAGFQVQSLALVKKTNREPQVNISEETSSKLPQRAAEKQAKIRSPQLLSDNGASPAEELNELPTAPSGSSSARIFTILIVVMFIMLIILGFFGMFTNIRLKSY